MKEVNLLRIKQLPVEHYVGSWGNSETFFPFCFYTLFKPERLTF